MAYASSAAPLRKILDGAAGALYASPSSGAGITGGGSLFTYVSSHAGTDITGAGFYTGCGAQPFSSTGTPHPNIASRHANAIGGRPGDLVVNIESSGGVTPGRVTMHAFSASTWGGSTSIFSTTAGWDLTVSAHAST